MGSSSSSASTTSTTRDVTLGDGSLFDGLLSSAALSKVKDTWAAGAQTVADVATDVRQAVSAALESDEGGRRRRKSVGLRQQQGPLHYMFGTRQPWLCRDDHVPMPTLDMQLLLVPLYSLARTVLDEVQTNGYESIKPVTTAVIAMNLVVFMVPNGVPLHQFQLCPARVTEHGEWDRLLSAPFIHFDATHLINNMAAALPDLLYLERRRGSAKLLRDIAVMIASSEGLYVAYAVCQKAVLGRPTRDYRGGTIGFSGVAMALQVLAGRDRACSMTMMGVEIPSQYAWAPGLLITTLCSPRASFTGHVCGVAAGLLQSYVIGPGLHLLANRLRAIGSGAGGENSNGNGRPTNSWGSGTTGGRRLSGSPTSRRQAGLRKWAKELGIQVALLAGTIVVITFTRRVMQATPKRAPAWR